MDRSTIETTLLEVASELSRVRAEMAETDHRMASCSRANDDLRLRAVASETPLAGALVIPVEAELQALVRTREALAFTVLELITARDRLLSQLAESS